MNQLILGDCLEIMPKMPDKCVDCVIADLPYGITKAKWDCELPLDKLWPEYRRLCRGPILLFASQPFTAKLISSNIEWFKYCWYWEKEKGTGFLNAQRQPLRCIEEICVFYDQGTNKYNPQMIPLEKPYRHKMPTKPSETIDVVKSFNEGLQYKEYTHSYPKNLLKYPRDNSNQGVHSTQKPVALMEYLIMTHTDAEDIILDNTMGSGTTCVAAKKLGRGYIGIEIDPLMFEVARKRVESV